MTRQQNERTEAPRVEAPREVGRALVECVKYAFDPGVMLKGFAGPSTVVVIVFIVSGGHLMIWQTAFGSFGMFLILRFFYA